MFGHVLGMLGPDTYPCTSRKPGDNCWEAASAVSTSNFLDSLPPHKKTKQKTKEKRVQPPFSGGLKRETTPVYDFDSGTKQQGEATP